MKVFKDENDNYQEWVKNNPHGFIINTRSGKNGKYRIAHKTSCRFISGADNPAQSTKNYIKVCATNPSDIADWFYNNKNNFDGEFQECGRCKPNINDLLFGEAYLFGDEIAANSTYLEGNVKQVLVNSYERNPQARSECLKYHGYNCYVCKINFSERYGELGKDFIHVHHLKQLSKIKKGYKVNPITDLNPVCPNCHAMLHRRNPPLTIDQLRKILK